MIALFNLRQYLLLLVLYVAPTVVFFSQGNVGRSCSWALPSVFWRYSASSAGLLP